MESFIPVSAYNMTISERLSHSISKEQYAFLYRTARVEILSTHQFDDPEDIFQRELYTVFVRSKLEGLLIHSVLCSGTKMVTLKEDIFNQDTVHGPG